MSDVDKSKTITILGTGYVGLTAAVLFAHTGYKVYAVDVNQSHLKAVRSGRSFFYEEGIDRLIKPAVKNGLLVPTDSYKDSIPASKFVFSCVGTPDNPDGSSNLDFVYQAAETAAKYMGNSSIYIQKSTVPVGTGAKVGTIIGKINRHIPYLSNPEFLREGTAIKDYLSGDRIVIGGSDSSAGAELEALYENLFVKRSVIAQMANISIDPAKPRYIHTGLESAELIKVTSNAFLALKISFANSIAKLADHTNADITEVMNAVGADNRIGGAFLNAGRGYGGGCFPKDVSGLIASATEHGVDLPIMVAASDVNESMPGYIANKLLYELGSFENKTIAVLGLAFKSGTSDARQSPGVKLANILSHSGASVRAFDPKSNHEVSIDLLKEIKIAASAEEAFDGCDAVCIATDWPLFTQYNLVTLAMRLRTKVLVDCMNSFDIDEVRNAGLAYIGVGRGSL